MTDNISIKVNGDTGEYRYTEDYVFMIEPEINRIEKNKHEITNNSPYLYIRKEEHDAILHNRPINHIDYTPLKKLIENKFIVLVDESNPTKNINFFISRSKNYNYEYYKYKFHRVLKDEIYGKDDDELTGKELNENDCLRFGECMTVANFKPDLSRFDRMIGVIDITSDEDLDKGKGGVKPVLQVKGTTSIFGDKTEDNIRLAKQFPEDNKKFKANPAVGESYAIVNYDLCKWDKEEEKLLMNPKTKKCIQSATPYHIAFVLCKDKNINITIEAIADSATDFEVKFGIYDTIDPLYTFQKSFEMLFRPEQSETIVLESRNMNDDFINDIENDIEARKDEYNRKFKIKGKNKSVLPTIANTAAKKRNASMISEEIPVNIPEPFVPSNETRKRTRKPSASRNKSVVKSTPSLKKKTISATSMNRNNTRKKTKFF